jgi:hypothetical protein
MQIAAEQAGDAAQHGQVILSGVGRQDRAQAGAQFRTEPGKSRSLGPNGPGTCPATGDCRSLCAQSASRVATAALASLCVATMGHRWLRSSPRQTHLSQGTGFPGQEARSSPAARRRRPDSSQAEPAAAAWHSLATRLLCGMSFPPTCPDNPAISASRSVRPRTRRARPLSGSGLFAFDRRVHRADVLWRILFGEARPNSSVPLRYEVASAAGRNEASSPGPDSRSTALPMIVCLSVRTCLPYAAGPRPMLGRSLLTCPA